MQRFVFTIRPYRDLRIFSLSLVLFFYMPVKISLILLCLILISNLFLRKRFLFISIIGSILGLSLAFILQADRSSHSTGIELPKITGIELELTEDSFLSSKGKTILRGKLLRTERGDFLSLSAKGRLLLIDGKSKRKFYQGEIIEVNSSISPFLDSKEFSYIVYNKSDILRTRWSHPLLKWRASWLRLLQVTEERFPPHLWGLFSALYLGDSDLLDRGFKDNFRYSGVPHLLALSGFHVAIVVLIITFGLRKIFGKRISYLLAIPFLLFYLFLAGISPSLLRSVVLFSLGATFKAFRKDIDLISLLLLSFILQVCFWPVQALSLSFQLSYLALIGILTLADPIRNIGLPYFPDVVLLSFSASLGAHITTAPVIIYFFGEIYPIGLLSSFVLTPLIVLFMWLSLPLFLISHLNAPLLLIGFFNSCCHWLYRMIELSLDIFSQGPVLEFSNRTRTSFYLTLLALIVLLLYGRGTYTQIKLRLTVGNKSPARNDGVGTQKEVESEFSH